MAKRGRKLWSQGAGTYATIRLVKAELVKAELVKDEVVKISA
jgi:hypothetical protein